MNIVDFYDNGELGNLTFQIRGPLETMKPIADAYVVLDEEGARIYDLECLCNGCREPQANCPRLQAIQDFMDLSNVTECMCMQCRGGTFPCFRDLSCPNAALTMLSPELGKESVLSDARSSALICIGDTYINGYAENNHHFIEEFLALSKKQPELEIVLHFAESSCCNGEHSVAYIHHGQVVYRRDTPNYPTEGEASEEQERVYLYKQGAEVYKEFLSRVIDREWFTREVCSGSMEYSPEWLIKYAHPDSEDYSHV